MTSPSITPQYQQVAATLRRRILSGEYREGDTIPTASELEADFSVSNITIRKALAVLSGEGRLNGRRGVGTIVTPAPVDQRVKIAVSGDFAAWADSASGRSLPITQTVLECAVKPGPDRVTETLGGAPGSDLWIMRRIRRVHDNVISYHVNFGLPAVFADVDKKAMAGNRAFVDVLREKYGDRLRRMDQTVEASAADRDLADLLDIAFGTPLFFVENIYRNDAERVAAVTHLFLRGDHYAYQTCIAM